MGNDPILDELRRRIRELESAEAQFRSIVETARDAVFCKDLDERYIHVNAAMERLAGLAATEMLGRTDDELGIGQPMTAVTSADARTLAGELANRVETSPMNGVDHTYQVTNIPSHDEEGRFTGWCGIVRDVTRRERAEEALWTSEERFRQVYHTAPLAFVTWDLACNVTEWNDRAERIFGWTREEVLGRNFFEFLIPENARPRVEDVVEHLLQGRVESEVINENLTKGGEVILCQWHNSLLRDMDGTIRGAISLALDITESRRAENELRASREQLRNLARHLHAVRENERALVARLIHDELGQTLTGLKMDLYWLQRQLRNDQRTLVESIDATMKHIDETVQTVQTISSELRPGLLDDLGLVAAIEWQAQRFQERTGIDCKVLVDPKDLSIDCDLATAMFRIFQEALMNVARHAGAERIRARVVHRDGLLELEVKDDGRGITSEQLADPQSFGLISMKERVLSWSGSIDITGLPDGGTTVRVVVPLQAAAAGH